MVGRFRIFNERLNTELIYSYRNLNGIMEIQCHTVGLGEWRVGEIPKGAILMAGANWPGK